MFEAGAITSTMFSMYLADDAYQSTFQIGGYDTSYLKNPSDLTWVDLIPNTPAWKVNVDGFRYGTADYFEHGRPSAYYIEYTSDAIIDSGLSLMLIP